MNQLWHRVNQDLVAKAIGELVFEQILEVREHKVSLKSGAVYEFEGWMTIWEHLRIKPGSLKRNGKQVTSAATFFIDSQSETGMDDITLGNFFEEMNNTLYADMALIKRNEKISLRDLSEQNDEQIQSYLSGHPKILLNKGRIGWGQEDQNNYAPESSKPFKLHWVAIRKELLDGSYSETVLDESLNDSEKDKIFKNVPDDSYAVIPVHPWQWKRIISIQFAGMLSNKDMVDLGEAGDDYLPQISLRTLSNVSRAGKKDIKLPLSILNTSCVRGITASTITLGTKISKILDSLVKSDTILHSVEILKEESGVAYVHPDYKKVKKAPYRYHEYFGAVWRESTTSKLNTNEKAILTSALFHQGSDRKPLFNEILTQSRLSAEEWVRKYFQVVIIPLYHLQVYYGVGMVAHGQNIVLKLKDSIPVGMFLKDFQGDLRLSSELTEAGKKFFSSIQDEMTKLPPNYLIHDLITGHFITVLRFTSGTLEETGIMKEEKFYEILSTEIQAYVKDKTIPDAQNLLRNEFERVLLNKVRFSIGYADTTLRPLPLVGSPLKNPLYKHVLEKL